MGFHDFRLRIEMKFPDMLQQHRPGHDVVRVLHEIFKQTEFARLKVYLSGAAPYLSTQQVHLEVRDPQRGLDLREGRAA